MTLLLDIPLEEEHPDELLGIFKEDFYEVGWGFVPNLAFFIDGPVMERALVLVLHSPNKPEKMEGDVEIAFWLDDEDVAYLEEEIEAHTTLTKFLRLRLPEIVERIDCNDLVLCVCNPHHSIIQRPECVPQEISVHFPKGDVHTYKDVDGHMRYTLVADEWVTL